MALLQTRKVKPLQYATNCQYGVAFCTPPIWHGHFMWVFTVFLCGVALCNVLQYATLHIWQAHCQYGIGTPFAMLPIWHSACQYGTPPPATFAPAILAYWCSPSHKIYEDIQSRYGPWKLTSPTKYTEICDHGAFHGTRHPYRSSSII